MRVWTTQLWILLAASLLAGCSALPSSTSSQANSSVAAQPSHCIGIIQAPTAGLKAISDPDLPKSAKCSI